MIVKVMLVIAILYLMCGCILMCANPIVEVVSNETAQIKNRFKLCLIKSGILIIIPFVFMMILVKKK